MKSGPLTIAVLLCASILSVSFLDRGQAVGPTPKAISERQQRELVKRINRRAERFYKTFMKKILSSNVTLDTELNQRFEDLLLTIDGLADPLYRKQNLIIAMRLAVEIEHLLLMADVSSAEVLAWASLHADIDLLAKANRIRWSEAVVTRELIAAFLDDVDKFSKAAQAEFSQFHVVSLTTTGSLPLLLENFRRSTQALDPGFTDAGKTRARIETVRNHARPITESLNSYQITVALRSDWKRVTARLELFIRLYSLN